MKHNRQRKNQTKISPRQIPTKPKQTEGNFMNAIGQN